MHSIHKCWHLCQFPWYTCKFYGWDFGAPCWKFSCNGKRSDCAHPQCMPLKVHRMETYKDSVYPCNAGGTPANIDGDEGQEHHRAPGTGSIFNHSSLGKETVLNLSLNWTNSLLANFCQVSVVGFFLFTRGSLFIQEECNPFLDHVFSHELSVSLHSYVLNKSSHWTSVLDFILPKTVCICCLLYFYFTLILPLGL